MARTTERLTARGIGALAKPGRHADGAGLYLVVDKGGAKRWVFLFRWNGRLKEMGLGGLTAVPLAQARKHAAQCREHVQAGRNPIDERKRDIPAFPTFKEAADALVDSLESEWRNAKHRYQWRQTLEQYAKPLHALAVDKIATEDVLRTLKPIWTTMPETASRLRGRIERVLDAAKALGHRQGENPAAWRGHLQSLLPKRKRLIRGHHRAVGYDAVPAFVAELHERDGVAALALEFTILSAARSGETLGSTWSEIDVESKIWTIPADRMKAGREHRVPLPDRAMKILSEVASLRAGTSPDELVFPGYRRGRPLSNMSLTMLMRRMGVAATPHGFRSSFRDWCGEVTSFPREVAEAALAHIVGDEVERAYRRGDALEKRRQLMDAWARFCAAAGGDNVIKLDQRK